jgi:hypothetical protein
MPRLVYRFILIWIVHAAVTVAIRKSVYSQRDHTTMRKLQSFGVVEGPSPTAKPNLPPIFAPIAVPITKPVSLPVPITRPVAVPVPISKPVVVLPVPITKPSTTSGFGNGGGGAGSETIDHITPTTTPTAETSTVVPTSVTSTVVPITPTATTTSTPTSASGVVVIDDGPTSSATTAKSPTKAPTSVVVVNTPPVPTSWLSFVVTYTSELHTVVKDPKKVLDILRTVHGDVRKALSQLIRQQNVSIVIELLESELLGT